MNHLSSLVYSSILQLHHCLFLFTSAENMGSDLRMVAAEPLSCVSGAA